MRMTSDQEYIALILEGLRDLPADALAEVAGFVWLTRKRVLTPQAFEDELHALRLRAELQHLRTQELQHLEQEVAVEHQQS